MKKKQISTGGSVPPEQLPVTMSKDQETKNSLPIRKTQELRGDQSVFEAGADRVYIFPGPVEGNGVLIRVRETGDELKFRGFTGSLDKYLSWCEETDRLGGGYEYISACLRWIDTLERITKKSNRSRFEKVR